MIYKSGNYAFKEPPFKDGDTITGGNYMQIAPGTEICVGVKNLTVTGGNLVNCVKQPTWDCPRGNWCQVSRCSHKHPGWLVDATVPCLLCGVAVDVVVRPDGLEELVCPGTPESVFDPGGPDETLIPARPCPYRRLAVMARCDEDCVHRSGQKVEVELSYEQVVERKKKGKPLPEYKSEKVKDKDGIDVLKHTVKEYVYKDKVQDV